MNIVHELGQVDLNLLVAFHALHQERSVTRAGRALGVTQSAMSHTLRRLRDLTGDPLFVRDGRHLAPTPRAEAMIGPVREALSGLARAVVEPPSFDPDQSQWTFGLASVDLFDLVLLPRILARLREEAPGVGLTVRPHGADTVARLHRGELDLAVHPVLEGSLSLPTAGLVGRTLFREGFSVFCREDHPLDAGRDLDAFCAAEHLVVSPAGGGATLVDHALEALGRSRRVAVRLPQFAAALSLLFGTDLVLTAPATLRALAPPGIRVSDPPLQLPDHAITLVWSERFHHDPGHRWLRERFEGVRPGAAQRSS